MGKRSRKQPRRNHSLAWLATAVLGLAALWLGVSPERLRSDPAQALKQIAPAIARAGSGTGTAATPEPAPSGQWPGFLTPEARQTVALIQRGGPYPYRQDGTVFGNRERLLPPRERGWYREYTVDTPGLSHRGPRRIVTGGHPPREWYYTADHYASFRPFTPPASRH